MIATFYSYKGGTGRTMAMANIAVLLSMRGKKVLIVDFDLEAPGLWRYFHPFYDGLQWREGLIDLLLAASSASDALEVNWRDYVTEVSVGSARLSLITSGQAVDEYPSRVLEFNWTSFFRESGGGEFIERMREQWKSEYDFILIDSRTGITDAGGICTILLPDMIVPFFVSNFQSLEGIVEVVKRAQERRGDLAYDRPPAVVLPVLSRFDSRTEFESAQDWLNIAAERLKQFYADWLPAKINPRQALERTKLPYVAYFSFGEAMPVFTHGVSDPDSLGYALSTVSQLIEDKLGNAELIMGGSTGPVERLATANKSQALTSPYAEGSSPAISKPETRGSSRTATFLRLLLAPIAPASQGTTDANSPVASRDTQSIAMWGAPSSGKTTFLAALTIALVRQDEAWKLVGADSGSTAALIYLTTALLRDRTFPSATQGIEHYRWLLLGQAEIVVRRRWLGTRRQQVPAEIGLHLIDASGEIAGPGSRYLSARTGMIGTLEQSRGIVFFFDPVREFTIGDSFDHLFGVMAELASRMLNSPESTSGWLPHYVAVCITKFDDLRVMRTAQDMALLEYDPDDRFGFPRVDDDNARRLFARLCDVSKSGSADLVMRTLERHFRPERIKYFVTSSIGFDVDSHTGKFNPDDYQNSYDHHAAGESDPQKAHFRGSVHPINVVEPLLWLASRLVRQPVRPEITEVVVQRS
jgi:cellulose biosynthesis protein BcsQ